MSMADTLPLNPVQAASEQSADIPLTPEQIEQQKQAADALKSMLYELGGQCSREFAEAKTYRLEMEKRWIEDLRQFKGIYDPETVGRLAAKKRSKLFLRLTRSKVKSLNARLGDMLFPAGDKNWTIQSTPVPSLPEDMYQTEIAAIVERDGALDEKAMRTAIDAIAKDRSEKMSKEIDDQLEEGNYEAECRKVIGSGNLFGTGVLKGPLGTPKQTRRWRLENGHWTSVVVNERKPHFNFVPLWHYYPDPLATDRAHARYEMEYRPMTPSDVAKLKRNPSYFGDALDEVLKRFPSGNVTQLEQWEADLRQISREKDNKPLPTNRFAVVERWGTIKGSLLKACGLPVDDENIDYEGQVWFIQDTVIRIEINPYDSESRPFKLFYFDKDESSIWGEGIASIMRDTQRGANTSLRAMVDNAAMAAVPNLEVNTTLMPQEGDVDNFSAGRVWKRTGKGQDSQYPAVRVIDIPVRINEFSNMLKMFMELGDEVTTIPRFTYGGTDGSNVSKTVGGLSMLMGQANISLKDLAKNWDDGITTPFIGDMYQWNMQFSGKEEIKGDYDVIARGASSLVAKEIRANALSQFTGDLVKLAPNLAKVRDLFAERARNLDLDPDQFLKTQEEADNENAEMQMGKVAMQTIATISKAMGITPEQFVEQVDDVIATMSAAPGMQPAAAPQPAVAAVPAV